MKRKNKTNQNKQINISDDHRLNATNETVKIIVYYILISFLWIFTSDLVLKYLIEDIDIVGRIQTVKGIFFILLTGSIFYVILHNRVHLYINSIVELQKTNTNLEFMHEKSIELEKKLVQLAYYDELTGLPNKVLLEEKVNEYLVITPNEMMAIIYIDIDEFRNVNEVKGHQVGDELIKLVAKVMAENLKTGDILCHTGGDEFVVAVFNVIDLTKFLSEVGNFLKNIKQVYYLDKDEYYITFSMGIALAPDHGSDYITLLRHADSALSMAKKKGKDQFVVFDDEMVTMITQQTELLNQLRNAIPNHEFSLHYQPVIDLNTGDIVGAEALIRWHNKIKGYIPPLEFISLSEKNGYIKEITEWVFYQVAKDLSFWPKQNEFDKVSINISAVILIQDSFLKYLNKWIKQYQIDAKRIILEITETAVISDINKSIHVLLQLKKLGFTIALDDFGTGYSSLTYLQRLPIDIIKIDRSFISNINKSTKEFHVLKYMIDLAHHLNLIVVAEGIEIIEQQHMVKAYQGDLAQGYYYCKPMPKEQLVQFIKTYKNKI